MGKWSPLTIILFLVCNFWIPVIAYELITAAIADHKRTKEIRSQRLLEEQEKRNTLNTSLGYTGSDPRRANLSESSYIKLIEEKCAINYTLAVWVFHLIEYPHLDSNYKLERISAIDEEIIKQYGVPGSPVRHGTILGILQKNKVISQSEYEIANSAFLKKIEDILYSNK